MELKNLINLNKAEIIGLIFAVLTVIVDVIFLRGEKIFYFILGIAFVIAAIPFFIFLVLDTKKEQEKEERFLELARDLVEGVKSGIPISKSIINVKDKDYGVLTEHIRKMANQITLGIPVRDAFDIFARDIGNKTIMRSITLIKEAERTGGNIETILDSVASSVTAIEKLKKERESAIYSLVVQGYIIYFIFIIIILVMQFKILPMTSGITNIGGVGDIGVSSTPLDPEQLSNTFLYLLITQGFFAGLVIGKISSGSIKAGLKHSIILVIMSLLISTGARIFM